MNVPEKISRFVQGTLIVLALGMLTIGAFAFTVSQPSKVNEYETPHIPFINLLAASSGCAVHLTSSTNPSGSGMHFTAAGAAAQTGYWECVRDGTATCNWFLESVCWTSSFVVYAGLIALGFGGAVKIGQWITKLIARDGRITRAIVAAVLRLAQFLDRLPRVEVTIRGNTYGISFKQVAAFLVAAVTILNLETVKNG